MLFRSNDTATTEIYTVPYTLSLHDALPIPERTALGHSPRLRCSPPRTGQQLSDGCRITASALEHLTLCCIKLVRVGSWAPDRRCDECAQACDACEGPRCAWLQQRDALCRNTSHRQTVHPSTFTTSVCMLTSIPTLISLSLKLPRCSAKSARAGWRTVIGRSAITPAAAPSTSSVHSSSVFTMPT